MDKTKILELCKNFCENTLMQTLNIEFIDAGEDFLTAKMPVNSKVHQPRGLLHVGASVALAESVGRGASMLFLDPIEHEVRGIEISDNHLKNKREGTVFAIAKMILKGRTLHLW